VTNILLLGPKTLVRRRCPNCWTLTVGDPDCAEALYCAVCAPRTTEFNLSLVRQHGDETKGAPDVS
jgi:hypothetical protein